jgi:hypothetical protein
MRVVLSRNLSRLCYLLALLLCIVLVRAILSDAYGFIGDSWRGGGTADKGGTSATFKIAGDATAPMSPGISVPIALRFTNFHGEPMSVTHLRVTIRELNTPEADANHPCSLDDFVVHQVKSSVRVLVPPNTTADLHSMRVAEADWPRIGMVNRSVNQDGCRNARLKLSYSAFGSLAS